MNKGNSQPPKQHDSVVEALWLCFALLVVIVIIWAANHEVVSFMVMKIRQGEAVLLPFDKPAQRAIAQWVAAVHPRDATLDQLYQSGEIVGRLLSWASMAMLSALGVFLIYRSPDWPGRYTSRYTMASLAKQESELWPAIKPVLDQNLLDVSLDDPIQGMRKTARVYGRQFKFIVSAKGMKELPTGSLQLNPREILLEDRCALIMGKQLGRPWEGVSALKPHERALFAVFAAQANYDNDAAKALVDALPDMFMLAIKKKNAALITTKSVDAALDKYAETEVVRGILAQHLYVRTVLMSLLLSAREKGIMPPSWFRWLKVVDRITWYSLNDLGTENASAEAAGVRSHWNAERLLRTPLAEPEIAAAVNGVREYLLEILDEDDE